MCGGQFSLILAYDLSHLRFRGTVRGGFEVVDDLPGENIGIGEIVGVFEALVSEPEDVEAGLVAVDEFFAI
jgi:hypothetical protein